jgi:hypothetical protein
MSGFSDVHVHDCESHPLLEKPFTPSTLSAAVREVLDGSREEG